MRSNLNAVIESAIMFDYLILMVMMIDGIDCGRYPYKPLYGLPSECLLEQHNRFDRCEVDAIKYYSLELDHFYTQTDPFCCFVWDTLHCELDVATVCNKTFANQLKQSTLDRFQSFCAKVVGYDDITNFFSRCKTYNVRTFFQGGHWYTSRYLNLSLLGLSLASCVVGIFKGCHFQFPKYNLENAPNMAILWNNMFNTS